jgi:hypothetical protein
MTQIPSGRLELPRDPSDSDDFIEAPRPARVSLLALFSMIIGILTLLGCCIPFVGPVGGLVAVVLGFAGFMMIRRSEGRLRGWGAAAAGVVTGLIAAVVGSVLLVLLAQAAYASGAYQKLVEIGQREDQSELVGVLTVESANAITTEELVSFRERSLDTLGAIKGVRGGVLPWLQAYAQAGRLPPAVQQKYVQFGTSSILAIPVRFEKGDAALVVAFDPQQPDPQLMLGRVVNAAIAPLDGSDLIWLIDPARDLSLPPPAAAPATPPAIEPAAEPITEPAPADSPPGG